jgi:hypothetical protein
VPDDPWVAFMEIDTRHLISMTAGSLGINFAFTGGLRA